MAAALGVFAIILSIAASVVTPANAANSPPKYQYGINTYFTYGCVSNSTVEAWAKTTVAQYKALRANAIAIAFPIYSDSITSNVVYARYVCGDGHYMSPPADAVAILVDVAHGAGLQVLLRPLLDESRFANPFVGLWRGVIAPTNLNQWFTSYLTTLRPYLQMAQQHHVERFAISTELNSISQAPNWTSAIHLVRVIFHGDLSFDYSFGSAVPKTLHPGTSAAIDTYPSLTGTTRKSTTAKLAAKWSALTLKPYYALPTTPSTIQEVGIAAQDGAYAKPSTFALPLTKYPFDQNIQANWFTAACTFMKSHHMRGIYFWGKYLGWDQGSLLKQPEPQRTSDFQPAAQQAIKRCFRTS
jgi:hypothetical protein